jgi:hypothetical protein
MNKSSRLDRLKRVLITLIVGLLLIPKGAFAEDNAAFSSPAASRSYEMTGNMALSTDPMVLVAKVLTGSDISQMQRSTGCSTGCSSGCY